jgi:GNAT superfamily N-acetyltransferase
MKEAKTGKVKNLDTSDQSSLTTVTKLLAREFYGRNPEKLSRGEEIFRISILSGNQIVKYAEVEGGLVGITTYKTYAWEKIAKQLYFQGRYERNHLKAVRLRSFGDLVEEAGLSTSYSEVIELAYTTVVEAYRGQGIGRTLFEARLGEILSKYHQVLVFTLARGPFAETDINQQVTNYLLSVEREVNGVRDDGLVRIRGVWVKAGKIRANTGYGIGSLAPISGSGATIHLAQGYKFIPIGFSRNFAPLLIADSEIIREKFVRSSLE